MQLIYQHESTNAKKNHSDILKNVIGILVVSVAGQLLMIDNQHLNTNVM
jgi:hypothetical protein